MKLIVFAAVLFATAVAARDGHGPPHGGDWNPDTCHLTAETPKRPSVTPVTDVRQCPEVEPNQCGEHCIVDISGSPVGKRDWRSILKEALKRCNTTVRLGPFVDLDFSVGPEDLLPLKIGRCVTLTGVGDFDVLTGVGGFDVPTPARTPHARGPVLKYRPAALSEKTLLNIPCDNPDGGLSDHIRISGFRLEGPTQEQQFGGDVGITITGCSDVEISNMEIHGWGYTGIDVRNTLSRRIIGFDEVRIHDNFIHHNQHPSKDGALGYGVGVGAWAHIYRNVFDFNRHAIAAGGDSGGYIAEENLVLRGGGYHGSFWSGYTHQFDVHGTGCPESLCGDAGTEFRFYRNSFQYDMGHAIKIRGTPRSKVNKSYIGENVFPHPLLSVIRPWWWPFGGGPDRHAIFLTDTSENIEVGLGNIVETDTFGEYYSQCDFNGDGIDDLFLATGATWWYSSAGKFHWSFLNTSSTRAKDLRFGYFDDDNLCDVVRESGGSGSGRWVISSGATSPWKPLEQVWPTPPLEEEPWKPLKDVQFGRFDPNDLSRGRQTTHAFYRQPPNGRWYVKKLSEPASKWEYVGGSSFPMSELRFGDFTGDGVTDVLAVESGSWAYSESARKTWQPLNRSLRDPVAGLLIANMDPDDDVDDILRLELQEKDENVDLTWLRSKDGRFGWRVFKRYSFRRPLGKFQPPGGGFVYPIGFVGRFGAASGGTLSVDEKRIGHFFSPGSKRVAPPEWTSLFPY